MKQHQAVLLTLEKLGGIATLAALYTEVLKIKECLWETKTPHASIRRIVQKHPLIFKVRPGLWALESHRGKLQLLEPAINEAKNKVLLQENTHSYYQGIVLELGNLRKLNTFAPHQDKNKLFLNKKIAEVRSLNTMPHFSYEAFVKRSQTIDAIWFNERLMPDTFFEIEHSTDIQNSLLKFFDLKDFAAKMVIVAAQARRKEFEAKLGISAFSDIRSRIKFLTYETLIHQFEDETFKANQGFFI
ncbi:MAG: hypothetical protein RLZZ156_314 [Deinococcota bacterium]|jgi:hypothetical protein